MMATKNPYQGDDYDFFEAARDKDTGEIKKEPVNINKPAAKETFKEAFASARKAGKGTFTWNGRKYTTEMAKPAAKSAPAKSAQRVGPTKERAAGLPPMDTKTAPKPIPKAESPVRAEMKRNTASNAAANRERMEMQRKAREERKAKSSESKSLFGRNPKGKTPDEMADGFAKGGSVRGYGIARGGKKCKMV
jgi:hypothetical protein